MPHSTQFNHQILRMTRNVSTERAVSLLEERVAGCQHYLTTNPNFQSFFWVQNTLNGYCKNSCNFGVVMGHEQLASHQTIGLAHPQHLLLQQQLYLTLNQCYLSGRFGKSILKFNFVVTLPLQHANGSYQYVRQRVSACTLNTKHQAIRLLNWYDVLEPYNGQPITLKIYSNQGQRMLDLEQTIKVRAGYYEALPFTKRQREILELLVQRIAPDLSSIAKRLHLDLTTVYTHTRNIKERANKHYNRFFRDIFQVADFFTYYEIFRPLT